jgi:hypothetical protein
MSTAVASAPRSTLWSQLRQHLEELCNLSAEMAERALCTGRCWITRRNLASGDADLILIPGEAFRMVSHSSLARAVGQGGAVKMSYEMAMSPEYRHLLDEYLMSLSANS